MDHAASQGPIARDAFDTLAGAYAERVETKPHNAYYEWPATESLLPEVTGMRVLDAGCGPGAGAARLVERGALVVGIDASPRMIELARRRVPSGATFEVADMDRDLEAIAPESFDLVLASLSLDYVRDLGSVFPRFHRGLRPGGLLVFSIGHPFFDFDYFGSDDYYATESVTCQWTGFGFPVQMPSYRRPFGAVVNPLVEAGFRLDRVLEPRPTEAFRRTDPEGHAELLKRPAFLCVRAHKPDERGSAG